MIKIEEQCGKCPFEMGCIKDKDAVCRYEEVYYCDERGEEIVEHPEYRDYYTTDGSDHLCKDCYNKILEDGDVMLDKWYFVSVNRDYTVVNETVYDEYEMYARQDELNQMTDEKLKNMDIIAYFWVDDDKKIIDKRITDYCDESKIKDLVKENVNYDVV